MSRRELELQLESLHPAAFGWAMTCCARRRADAEDVLQATYEKVLDGRARWDGRSSWKTWLYAVIRRTASERRRARALRGDALARWVAGRPEAAPARGPDASAAASEAGDRLARALAELPRRQREVLHLVFDQELSIEDAASVLGMRPGTASTHYKRGKARLRDLLAGRAALLPENATP